MLPDDVCADARRNDSSSVVLVPIRGLVSVEGVSDGVVRLRKDGFALIIDCDSTVSRLLGWTAEEMLGKRTLDFIHPGDRQRTVESWVQMLEAPERPHHARWRHRHKDGSFVWVDVTNHNLLQSVGHVLAEIVETTDRQPVSDEAESDAAISDEDEAATLIARMMSEKEWFLRRLTERLPMGVALTSAEGTLVYANSQMRQLLFASTATALPDLFSWVVDEDRLALTAALEAALGDRSDEDLELRVCTPQSTRALRCLVSIRALGEPTDASAGLIVTATDVTESARLREELERRATIDHLTGCHNRETTVALLAEMLGAGIPTAAVYIDINRFKTVNDRHGHAAGDELLANIASRLLRAARAGDVVGRIGGDEFLVVCPGVPDTNTALAIAFRVAEALRGPVPADGSPPGPSASVGVARTQAGITTPDQLIAAADTAMYEAKRTKSPFPVLFKPDGTRTGAHPAQPDPFPGVTPHHSPIRLLE
jgi:diguanylate cyclase (GGDEF)-like protein/PAS domain S-box-containing protein